MSKLSDAKIKYERLPSEDKPFFLKRLTNINAYANIRTPLRKGKPMAKKQPKTSKTKTSLAPISTLVDVLARSVAIAFLLEPFFMQETQYLRIVMGLAIVWLALGLAGFAYKMFVKPAAKAISEA